jgi:hypothetical protein
MSRDRTLVRLRMTVSRPHRALRPWAFSRSLPPRIVTPVERGADRGRGLHEVGKHYVGLLVAVLDTAIS